MSRRTRRNLERRFWNLCFATSFAVSLLWLLGLPVASSGGFLAAATEAGIWRSDLGEPPVAARRDERLHARLQRHDAAVRAAFLVLEAERAPSALALVAAR